MPKGYKVNCNLLCFNTVTTAAAAASLSIHLSTSCNSSLPLAPCFFLPLFLLLFHLLQYPHLQLHLALHESLLHHLLLHLLLHLHHEHHGHHTRRCRCHSSTIGLTHGNGRGQFVNGFDNGASLFRFSDRDFFTFSFKKEDSELFFAFFLADC
jgi:hypothetical protein